MQSNDKKCCFLWFQHLSSQIITSGCHESACLASTACSVTVSQTAEQFAVQFSAVSRETH